MSPQVTYIQPQFTRDPIQIVLISFAAHEEKMISFICAKWQRNPRKFTPEIGETTGR